MNRISAMLNDIPGTLITLIIVVLALSVHEAAHGYAAYKMGDSTALAFGRLTLNPFKHLDPLGFICMFLFGFGWAKPVPINTRNFDKPRLGMAVSALAGPLANIGMYLIGHILFRLSFWLFASGIITLQSDFALNLFRYVLKFFSSFAFLNLGLAIFNLIPIPPLDGSRILLLILPPKYYFGIMKYEQYIQIALIALLWTGLLTGALSTVCTFVYNGVDGLLDLVFRLS